MRLTPCRCTSIAAPNAAMCSRRYKASALPTRKNAPSARGRSSACSPRRPSSSKAPAFTSRTTERPAAPRRAAPAPNRRATAVLPRARETVRAAHLVRPLLEAVAAQHLPPRPHLRPQAARRNPGALAVGVHRQARAAPAPVSDVGGFVGRQQLLASALAKKASRSIRYWLGRLEGAFFAEVFFAGVFFAGVFFAGPFAVVFFATLFLAAVFVAAA